MIVLVVGIYAVRFFEGWGAVFNRDSRVSVLSKGLSF